MKLKSPRGRNKTGHHAKNQKGHHSRVGGHHTKHRNQKGQDSRKTSPTRRRERERGGKMWHGVERDDSDYASDVSLEGRASDGGRQRRKEGKTRDPHQRSRRTPPGKSAASPGSRSQDALDNFVGAGTKVKGRSRKKNGGSSSSGGGGNSPGSDVSEKKRAAKASKKSKTKRSKTKKDYEFDGNRNRSQSRGSQILSTLTQLLTQTMRLSPAAPESEEESVKLPAGTSITEIEEINLAPADNGDMISGKATRNVFPVRRHWDGEDG